MVEERSDGGGKRFANRFPLPLEVSPIRATMRRKERKLVFSQLWTLVTSDYAKTLVPLQKMSSVVTNPIENSIRKKLMGSLNPSYIEIINESYMHNVPKGSETHFKVIVVSDKFTDKPLLKRHQMINNLLQVELENGVHALSIVIRACKSK
ncbi:DNA-binding transcriptional regulator BolA isoform X2 [Osmia lignaria lignaria]|uniref:DNA-binding transcriptional regulator BolA isoform X2 n=1 Tax=Osmia lignaria lignaria TaxID=1437193 RepID=UPI001478FEC1|nr:DNA-binding transcriptional regulator BolA isoform X2 [Osmia lignaria]